MVILCHLVLKSNYEVIVRMTELLKEEVGYILFVYPTSCFYIRTSFNPDKCAIRPGYFFDLDTGRYVPRHLIEGVQMEVTMEEPLDFKQQSDFWKALLLEACHAGF